jgi:hypothetical protein
MHLVYRLREKGAHRRWQVRSCRTRRAEKRGEWTKGGWKEQGGGERERERKHCLTDDMKKYRKSSSVALKTEVHKERMRTSWRISRISANSS